MKRQRFGTGTRTGMVHTGLYIYIIYLYGPMVSRPLWGLSPNLITPSPSPGLTPPLSPFGQMISISSHPPSHPSSYPVNCSLRSEVIAQSYSFSVARQHLGNIDAEHIRWSGKQFQGHSYHTPLSIHIAIIILDLLPTNPKGNHDSSIDLRL